MITDFLKVVANGKDVGLIVVADEQKLASAAEELKTNDFKPASGVGELLNYPRVYFVVGAVLDKEVYDFAAQYQTGSVEIFDKETMQSTVTNIDYTGRSVVFLITEDNLIKVEAAGFGLRQVVGPVEQI